MAAPGDGAARAFELGADVAGVVELAVVDDDQPAVVRAHRLVAVGREIENGEPSKPEREPGSLVDEGPAVVRPAVADRVGHRRHARRQRVERPTAA